MWKKTSCSHVTLCRGGSEAELDSKFRVESDFLDSIESSFTNINFGGKFEFLTFYLVKRSAWGDFFENIRVHFESDTNLADSNSIEPSFPRLELDSKKSGLDPALTATHAGPKGWMSAPLKEGGVKPVFYEVRGR